MLWKIFYQLGLLICYYHSDNFTVDMYPRICCFLCSKRQRFWWSSRAHDRDAGGLQSKVLKSSKFGNVDTSLFFPFLFIPCLIIWHNDKDFLTTPRISICIRRHVYVLIKWCKQIFANLKLYVSIKITIWITEKLFLICYKYREVSWFLILYLYVV